MTQLFSFATLRPHFGRASLAAALLSLSVLAAAENAPVAATVVLATAATGGARILNINAPNAAGISTTVIGKLDPDANLIINNVSRMTPGGAAGAFLGNRHLKTSGPARIIIIRASGSNPAILTGRIEVAGSPAQLIVVSPNGIMTTASTEFVHVPWASLTTGAPEFGRDGSLVGFGVAGGAIIFGGLRAPGRLDVLAGALTVCAGARVEAQGDMNINAATINVGGRCVAEPS